MCAFLFPEFLATENLVYFFMSLTDNWSQMKWALESLDGLAIRNADGGDSRELIRTSFGRLLTKLRVGVFWTWFLGNPCFAYLVPVALIIL